MKSFDQFLEENPFDPETIMSIPKEFKSTGNSTEDQANLLLLVFSLSKKYIDVQLRAYHDWLTSQIETPDAFPHEPSR